MRCICCLLGLTFCSSQTSSRFCRKRSL